MTDNARQTRPAARARATSLTELVAAVERPDRRGRAVAMGAGGRSRSWAALLALLNRWQFHPLVDTWITDPNWSHGFLIPLFSLYLLYARREELLSAPRRACLWGLPILLGGMG